MKQMPNFSIVVLGAMNPSIHHPSFYLSIGAISKGAAEKALRSPTVLCTPQAARFDLNDISMICMLDRWQISSSNESDLAEITDIAQRVMKTLYHTPVASFGFNLDLVVSSVRPIAPTLAKLARTLPLSFEDRESASASFIYSHSSEFSLFRRKVTSTVSAMDNQLSLRNNYHYDVTTKENFDLDDIIKGRLPVDLDEAKRQLTETFTALAGV